MKNRSWIADTNGLTAGHYFRRLIHLSLLFIPFLYKAYSHAIADFFDWPVGGLLLLLTGLVVLLEALRLKFQILLWGQRQYERHNVSALAWTLLAIIAVLFFAPAPAYYFAIIFSCALGDPLLGELRRFIPYLWLAEAVGLIFLLILWLAGAFYWGFSPWLATFLAILSLFVEYWNLKWIDDNALMLLVPLLAIIVWIQIF